MPNRTGYQDQDSKDNNQEQIVDFTQARAQKLEEKRRVTERIFFKHLLNVYSVVGAKTMFPIEFLEMSENGCSFQIKYDQKNPWPQNLEDLPIRIYFSQDTYLEIRISIKNSTPCIDNNERYTRFGCAIDESTGTYSAYKQFVHFLRLYSEHSRKDLGDISVFYV